MRTQRRAGVHGRPMTGLHCQGDRHRVLPQSHREKTAAYENAVAKPTGRQNRNASSTRRQSTTAPMGGPTQSAGL